MYLEEQQILLCGIDHGFSTMKTAHFVFENGVKELGGEATLTTNTMMFNDRYYKVGEGRLPLKDTKVEDEDYFLLTLAAIAKEMDYYQLSDADVCIAAGLPFTRFGQEKVAFKEYLNPGSVDFQYNGKAYHIDCKEVFLYPQCYAAVADRLGKLPAELLIVDIGSKTTDVVYLRNGLPVESRSITIEQAMVRWIRQIQGSLQVQFGKNIPENEILKVLLKQGSQLPKSYVNLIRKEIRERIEELVLELKERGYDMDYTNVIYVGGGAVAVRNFSEYRTNVAYDCDILANAKGYEFLADQMLRKQGAA